jgi:predicted RNA-binding protein YlqC (UPF0109 family)
MTEQDITPTNAQGVPHDRAFLEFVVKELVDHPEAVRVSRRVDEMGVLLTLDVHPEDMGKVIGRSGNTARAIRSLLRTIGMKYHARVNLKINEPRRGDAASPEAATQEVKHDAAAKEQQKVVGSDVSPEAAFEETLAELKK